MSIATDIFSKVLMSALNFVEALNRIKNPVIRLLDSIDKNREWERLSEEDIFSLMHK